VPAKQEVDAVVIFDGSGRMVYTTIIERGATEVLVQETLVPGVYRVFVKDPKGVVIQSSSVIVIDG
jgi:ABC-type sulfate transport system substrate-binding protein